MYSPNKAYYFAIAGPGRPEATLTIYTEKRHLVQIALTGVFGLSDVRWINEKLIFLRAWWGRIAGTDLIFDVENETIIYAESVADGAMAYAQFRQDCPRLGCRCIEARVKESRQ